MPEKQEAWVPSLSQEEPLEEEMETHSSILARRISRTEQLGKLYSPWGLKELNSTEQKHTLVRQIGLKRLGKWHYPSISIRKRGFVCLNGEDQRRFKKVQTATVINLNLTTLGSFFSFLFFFQQTGIDTHLRSSVQDARGSRISLCALVPALKEHNKVKASNISHRN